MKKGYWVLGLVILLSGAAGVRADTVLAVYTGSGTGGSGGVVSAKAVFTLLNNGNLQLDLTNTTAQGTADQLANTLGAFEFNILSSTTLTLTSASAAQFVTVAAGVHGSTLSAGGSLNSSWGGGDPKGATFNQAVAGNGILDTLKAIDGSSLGGGTYDIQPVLTNPLTTNYGDSTQLDGLPSHSPYVYGTATFIYTLTNGTLARSNFDGNGKFLFGTGNGEPTAIAIVSNPLPPSASMGLAVFAVLGLTVAWRKIRVPA